MGSCDLPIFFSHDMNLTSLSLFKHLSITDSKSRVPGHEQIQRILISKFGIPFELVHLVFSHLPITTLIDSLEFSYQKAMFYSRNVSFDSVKKDLIEIGGFELKHDGAV